MKHSMITRCGLFPTYGVITMECQYCFAVGDDVRETYDPYALEMRGELASIIACDDCRQNLADDV